MDRLVYHIDWYVKTTVYPTLDGLYLHLFNFSDNDHKDDELYAKLKLYLKWLEENERYEDCTHVLAIIKDYESRSI